ncbi:hypothetical protein FKB34_01140 [Glycocaulis profundi]|nr:hypothetical protein FKB34_01140 [Glycocaulis profundi]
MRIVSLDEIEPGPGECSRTLEVHLPRLPDAASKVLAAKVEDFLKVFLTDSEVLAARAARTGPLAWRVTCSAGLAAGLEWIRADIAAALFGADAGPEPDAEALKGGAVTLIAGVLDEAPAPAAETPAKPADAAAMSGPDPITLDLAGFRDDIATIAAELRSGSSIGFEIARFREEIDDMAEHMRHNIDAAAGRVESAADRVERAARAVPDPDRMELIMARNEASAAILERGVGAALGMLMDACRTITESADAAGQRRALPAPEDAEGDDAPLRGDRYVA